MNEEKAQSWFEKNKAHIGWAVVVLAIMAASFLGYDIAIPDPPAIDDVYLRLQSLEMAAGMESFSATGSGEGYTNLTNLALEDDLYVGDDATIVGDLDTATFSVTGDTSMTSLTLTGVLYPSFADTTITDGQTLTPTKTVYALDSAAAVTMTLAASGTEGQLLILIGDDANNITIADTNVRTNDGAAQVIGQYDVIMWVYQDSEWVEVSESSNS